MRMSNREFWEEIWGNNQVVSGYHSYKIAKCTKSRILDMGCENLCNSHLPEKSRYFIGIDIALTALKQAKSSIKKTKLVVGSALNLPFPDNTFDESFSFETISLLGHNWYRALEEMKRVTKKRVSFTLTHRDIMCTRNPSTSHEQKDGYTFLPGSELERACFTEADVDKALMRLQLIPEDIRVFTKGELTRDYSVWKAVSEYPDTKEKIYVTARK